MARKPIQLRFSRPSRRARADGLTLRQQALLDALRWTGRVFSADELGRRVGYAYPREACDRLVRRGLVEKVSAGMYRARILRERKV